MVATDVASRGLDTLCVDHGNCPTQTNASYVHHRTTGRMGRSGIAFFILKFHNGGCFDSTIFLHHVLELESKRSEIYPCRPLIEGKMKTTIVLP